MVPCGAEARGEVSGGEGFLVELRFFMMYLGKKADS